MIKIENVVLPSAEQWRSLILGARNAMNSWEKSDSEFCDALECLECNTRYDNCPRFWIGGNDKELMMKLANGGPVHAKYRRMIVVYVDILAPLYW